MVAPGSLKKTSTPTWAGRTSNIDYQDFRTLELEIRRQAASKTAQCQSGVCKGLDRSPRGRRRVGMGTGPSCLG